MVSAVGPERDEADQLDGLLRTAYDLRRNAAGSSEEGRVLAAIAADPRIAFRYSNARRRYRLARDGASPDTVLLLTIDSSEFQGVAAFLNLFGKCALGYMRDQAREIAGVRRLNKNEQTLLKLLQAEWPRAAEDENLATFLFNHRAALVKRAQSALGLSERQIIGAIEGLAAKRGLTRVELTEAAVAAPRDNPLDQLCTIDAALLVSGLVRRGVIPPPPREYVEPLLEIRFTREDLGGGTDVSELAAKRLGGTAGKWTQVFHRFKRKLDRFLAQCYPGLSSRDALEKFIVEEIK